MFVKESSIVLSRLFPINSFLRGTFGVIATSFKYDEPVQEFMRQQQYEQFLHDRLITCQKLVSDPTEKPQPNGTSDKSNTIKVEGL